MLKQVLKLNTNLPRASDNVCMTPSAVQQLAVALLYV